MLTQKDNVLKTPLIVCFRQTRFRRRRRRRRRRPGTRFQGREARLQALPRQALLLLLLQCKV